MNREKLFFLNEKRLRVVEAKMDNFFEILDFINKKDDPSPADLEKLVSFLEIYRENPISFKHPSDKALFEKILQFLARPIYEDRYDTDHIRRREFCKHLEKSSSVVFKIFSQNKLCRDNIFPIVMFVEWYKDWPQEADEISRLNKELKLSFCDLTNSDGWEKYESLSFAQKKLFVTHITDMAIKVLDLTLKPQTVLA